MYFLLEELKLPEPPTSQVFLSSCACAEDEKIRIAKMTSEGFIDRILMVKPLPSGYHEISTKLFQEIRHALHAKKGG
jgi:hypothetical protein